MNPLSMTPEQRKKLWDAHAMAREALASPSLRAAARETTDEEVREWCERIYREVGVTPALRKAYEFYRQYMPLHSLGGPQDG